MANAHYLLMAQRAAMMGKSGYTAHDYVQDGLTAMWDGIENAGWGVHNPDATVWKDLTDNGLDAELNTQMAGRASFGENCFIAAPLDKNGTTAARAQKGTLTNYKTLEIVYSHNLAGIYEILNVGDGNRGFYGTGRVVQFGTTVGEDRWRLIRTDLGYTDNDYLGVPFHAACTYSDSAKSGFLNGAPVAPTDYMATTGYNQGDCIGFFGEGRKTKWVKDYGASGSIYCLRIYNRALTAEEIAHNYAVDKARFNLP